MAIDSSSIAVHRPVARVKGAFIQGIGTSRGGRTSKIHELTDTGRCPRIPMYRPTMFPA